jgi:NADH-quinone oxidoreductase subunit C
MMLLDKIKERIGAGILEAQEACGDETIVVDRDHALEVMKTLRDDPDFAFNMLTDVTAVDWPERQPRFEVIYHLNSLDRHHRLRLKVRIGAADAWVHTAHGFWKSADWLERECFDMFGIQFRGHPDLRRILMYDEFVGHPLRKDYPYQRRQPLVPEVDAITAPRPSSR